MEAAETATLLSLILEIFISTMPCWLGLSISSPIPPFISSLVSLLEHGAFFYILRSLYWPVCAYFREGGGSDSEHI